MEPFTSPTSAHRLLVSMTRAPILNMLEYIGAWEWYDRQIKLSQATVRTKRNKLVEHKGASIHVLNKMQDLQIRTEQTGKWVSGVGRIDVTKEGNNSDMPPESCDASITERIRYSQRRRISMQLSRGQKLSTKLVRQLGIGILFSPEIWLVSGPRGILQSADSTLG